MSASNTVLRLDVDLIEIEQSLDVEMSGNSVNLDVELLGGGEGRLPYYLGEYVVDPRKVAQTLETANKSMREDVTINPIYYSEISNPSGGETAYIGME